MLVPPPSTYLLSARIWKPSDSSWDDPEIEQGSYVAPEDSNCCRRIFTLAGWSEKQKAYYYVPDATAYSLVYRRDESTPIFPFRYGGKESEEHNPRFFLHDRGPSKHRFLPANKFFHDDVQLNIPDLPGQPLPTGTNNIAYFEDAEFDYDSDTSAEGDQNTQSQWASDMKWGQDSGLPLGSIRRTIWQSDRWGIEFNLEPVPGRVEFWEHSENCSIKSYMVKATVIRVFVTQHKFESDANLQENDTLAEKTGDLFSCDSQAESSSCSDDLSVRLSDTYIY